MDAHTWTSFHPASTTAKSHADGRRWPMGSSKSKQSNQNEIADGEIRFERIQMRIFFHQTPASVSYRKAHANELAARSCFSRQTPLFALVVVVAVDIPHSARVLRVSARALSQSQLPPPRRALPSPMREMEEGSFRNRSKSAAPPAPAPALSFLTCRSAPRSAANGPAPRRIGWPTLYIPPIIERGRRR